MDLYAQRYRDRADHLRGMAKTATDADLRAEFQRIAEEYERLADQPGQRSRSR